MEQNKESEERASALTESDYVLIRMVVTDWCLLNNLLNWIKLYRWFKSNKESQKESRSNDLLFFLPFSPCWPCPTTSAVRRAAGLLICIGAEALPVADAARRRWSKTKSTKKGAQARLSTTMFWFVWSLMIDVYWITFWTESSYIVGLSPTRAATT